LSSGGNAFVAYSPTRLSAVIARNGNDQTLSVNRSVIVREDDDLYAPVREALYSKCSTELSSETVQDREMMFGRAVRSKWKLWAECPAKPHDCVALPIPEQEAPVGEVSFGLAVQGVQA
jgi:hypothetical protein